MRNSPSIREIKGASRIETGMIDQPFVQCAFIEGFVGATIPKLYYVGNRYVIRDSSVTGPRRRLCTLVAGSVKIHCWTMVAC